VQDEKSKEEQFSELRPVRREEFVPTRQTENLTPAVYTTAESKQIGQHIAYVPHNGNTPPTGPNGGHEATVVKNGSNNHIANRHKPIRPPRYCNKTFCCLGNCLGCLAMIICLLIMSLFAPSLIGKVTDLIVNPNLASLHTTEIADEPLKPDLQKLIEADDIIRFELTEERFNSYLEHERQLQVFADLKDGKAVLYYKPGNIAPHFTLRLRDFTEAEEVAIGFWQIDVSSCIPELWPNFFAPIGDPVLREDIVDAQLLMQYLLFGEKLSGKVISQVHFYGDRMEITLATI